MCDLPENKYVDNENVTVKFLKGDILEEKFRKQLSGKIKTMSGNTIVLMKKFRNNVEFNYNVPATYVVQALDEIGVSIAKELFITLYNDYGKGQIQTDIYPNTYPDEYPNEHSLTPPRYHNV